jgi:hypothetical protein
MENVINSRQDGFEAFQKFHSREQAIEVGEILKEAGIEYHVVQNKPYFDVSFAFNKTDPDINLVIRQIDFLKAREALQGYYESRLGSVDRDYYLFQFTDRELAEIIQKPDEWGSFDYELAKNILHERGIEITEDVESSIMGNRIVELSKSENINPAWIILGYLSAFLGGFLGIIIGWILAFYTKKLPNGERVYVYSEKDRKNGKIIFYLSIFSFIIFIGLKLYRNFPGNQQII